MVGAVAAEIMMAALSTGPTPDGSIDGELPEGNPEYDGGSIDGTDPV